MCDCYIDHCRICGSPVPMHLGDFLTERLEIAVVCPECMRLHEKIVQERGSRPFPFSPFEWLAPKRWMVWCISQDYTPEKDEYPKIPFKAGDKVAVIALTDNAWENRHDNLPNLTVPVNPKSEHSEGRKVEWGIR